MSGLMNKLGLGHKDAHHDDDVARKAGATHTATVENAAHKNGAATTTTTTTTTNQNATNATTGINSNAPYGASTSTSTARTGAAYSNTGAATINQQQTNGVFTERSGIHGDDAMTRSEEQLRVAKATVETGKAELNKYVETQHVEQAVPVSRERIVIEREAITPGNVGDALRGPAISEAHFETTLHEDRVAATKETVPIERIRLAKQTETHVESVGADLRKEHIDMQYTSLDDKINNQTVNQSGLHGSKIDTTTSHSGVHGGKIDPLGAHTTTGTTTSTSATRSAY